MREASFNETLQIGIVMHDLQAAMRSYVDDCGIGRGKFTSPTFSAADERQEL